MKAPPVFALLGMAWDHRALLLATSRVEFQRRYAGSALGLFWTAINPLLLLGVYLFLFLVVFKIRLPQYSGLGYAVMIFCGLVPFLCLTETVTGSAVALKQNIHLVKNVIMPIDLIPVRVVLIAIITQGFGLAALLALAAIQGELGVKALLLLPVALLLQLLFLLGLGLFISALGVLIPDIAHVLGTLMLFLTFLSPIAYETQMVPAGLEFVTLSNPIAYMIDAFRMALMQTAPLEPWRLGVFALLAMFTFWGGAGFFRRFKGVIVDYE